MNSPWENSTYLPELPKSVGINSVELTASLSAISDDYFPELFDYDIEMNFPDYKWVHF